MSDLAAIINDAFERRADIDAKNASPELRDAIASTLAALDAGTLRVAEPTDNGWKVNEWAKKAVLLSCQVAPPTTSIKCR